jgi:hypothetical protein
MILENIEIWYPKLDPRRPSARFNKDNPQWEIQGRTRDKDQKNEWEASGLSVKAILPDDGDPYWRINLKKPSIRRSGEPAEPVRVVDGNLNPIDPTTIGNGSIANIRLYQYEYPRQTGGMGTASILMAVQLTEHILYTPPPREDFGKTQTKTIAGDSGEPNNGFTKQEEKQESADYGEVPDKDVAPEKEKDEAAQTPSVAAPKPPTDIAF